MVNNWSSIIQDWVFPPTCLLCGDPGAKGLDLCAACIRALPYNDCACLRCALPLTDIELLCGDCQRKPPLFDSTLTLCRYEQPVSHLIRNLKFGADHACARTLGQLMADKLQALPGQPTVIIPTPLHPRRYRERGFNQSAEIASEIAKRLGIPLNLTACERVRNTPAQAGLTARERHRNLRQAFRVIHPGLPEHVAIVDDVITTGTTSQELARVLRKAGVKRIDVWALARVELG